MKLSETQGRPNDNNGNIIELSTEQNDELHDRLARLKVTVATRQGVVSVLKEFHAEVDRDVVN